MSDKRSYEDKAEVMVPRSLTALLTVTHRASGSHGAQAHRPGGELAGAGQNRVAQRPTGEYLCLSRQGDQENCERYMTALNGANASWARPPRCSGRRTVEGRA